MGRRALIKTDTSGTARVLRLAGCILAIGLAAPPRAARAGDESPAAPTVTVTGRRATTIRDIDRTIHKVADTPRAANGSAQDVLQATPGVAVTADGHIAVQGNERVTVLVDGKPSAMLSGSSEERALALQTMSGADVASVEAITNPSAAQNANGGAIVNIVLKRDRKPGAHTQLRASASDDNLWNTGASADFTRGPLSLHGSAALRRDGNRKIRRSAVAWGDPEGGTGGSTLQASDVFVRRIVDSAAAGADLALGRSDTLSIDARHNRRRSHPLFDVSNDVRSGAADTVFHRISLGPNEQSDDSADLAWSRRDGPTALKAAARHSTTTALVDKSYRDVYVAPQRPTAYSRGATRTARRLDAATLDWTRAAAHGQWGAGLDLQRKVDGIDNYQAGVDPATGAETPDAATTNGYEVTTTTRAAYVTGQVRRGRWEALLGARAEAAALRVGTSDAGCWRAFNPSLHARYAVDAGTDVTLAYRRSLQLPDPRDLDPHATYVDAQNLSRGNPGLQPQRMTSWTLDANAGGGTLGGSAGAFYRTSRDTVIDARSVAGTVLVTSKRNGGSARAAGLTGSLEWKPGGRWQLGVDGGAMWVALDTPDAGAAVRQRAPTGWINVRAAYRSGPDDVTLDAHAQAAGIVPLGRTGPTSSVNLAWKHALSRTLGLTVNANDLFDGSRRTYATDATGFRQAGFDHFIGRRVWVGFVKKFE